jgi:Type IX secretion system protein PorV
MKITVITLLLLLFVNLGLSSDGNQGKTGLSFLKIGIDARAVGMGEAYTAVTTDASAVYWNPAGLLGAKRSNVLFNHNEWILDIRGEFAGLSIVRSRSAWGFHINSFNIGEIAVREIPSSEPLAFTSAHYLASGLSYARRLHQRLDLGLSLKYLFEKIDVNTASGYAFDAGMIYRPPLNGLKLGATIQNLGSMSDLRNDQTSLPVLFRLGAAYQLPLKITGVDMNLASDLVKVSAENLHWHLGSEFLLWKQLALRAGWMQGYEARDFTLGLGFNRSSLRLDYGYLPSDLGTAHRFTINFNL